jgi:hypothetical protein
MASESCLIACLALLSACVIGKHDTTLPESKEAMIVLASDTMPAPINTIAVHAWFVVKEEGSKTWRRIEYGGVPKGEVKVHAIWKGKKASEGIRCLDRWKQELYLKKYWAYPGPNSNTYIDHLLRKCDLWADLPATAIGKDYRGRLIGASYTSGGTGFQVETPLVGFRLGLREGVEVHLLSLAFGIDLWPPALIVPFGEGRIGFADR